MNCNDDSWEEECMKLKKEMERNRMFIRAGVVFLLTLILIGVVIHCVDQYEENEFNETLKEENK